MKIAIVSATSTIGQAAARNWAKAFSQAQAGELEFVLLGRNQAALDVVAGDLRVRAPKAKASVVTLDMLSHEAIEAAVAKLGTLDVALICQGELTDQTTAQNDATVLSKSIQVNVQSPTLFAEAIARKFEQQGFGKLAIIGSVAGDRGRKSNYAYGASKAFLASYAQGLVHRFASTKVSVLLIKPGPTASRMTLNMPNPPAKLAEPDVVAAQIVKAINSSKRGVLYTPPIWAIIMLVVRLLPSFVFNRLNL
jgi:decaprenylphospho-beta-D-erythro-pentofuranosid-2-ulose 2-reductase